MSTDTPDEVPEWVMGPPPDYDPPPVDELRDPEVQLRKNLQGAELCRQVLADLGRYKVNGKWVHDPESATTADTD